MNAVYTNVEQTSLGLSGSRRNRSCKLMDQYVSREWVNWGAKGGIPRKRCCHCQSWWIQSKKWDLEITEFLCRSDACDVVCVSVSNYFWYFGDVL